MAQVKQNHFETFKYSFKIDTGIDRIKRYGSFYSICTSQVIN